jgi:hypothetical protein
MIESILTISSYQEEGHVVSRTIITVERNRVNRISPFESTASDGARALELWNGARQIVWYYAGLRDARATNRMFGSKPRAAFTGMVLWSQKQTGSQTTRIGREHVFCPFTRLDA